MAYKGWACTANTVGINKSGLLHIIPCFQFSEGWNVQEDREVLGQQNKSLWAAEITEMMKDRLRNKWELCSELCSTVSIGFWSKCQVFWGFFGWWWQKNARVLLSVQVKSNISSITSYISHMHFIVLLGFLLHVCLFLHLVMPYDANFERTVAGCVCDWTDKKVCQPEMLCDWKESCICENWRELLSSVNVSHAQALTFERLQVFSFSYYTTFRASSFVSRARSLTGERWWADSSASEFQSDLFLPSWVTRQ